VKRLQRPSVKEVESEGARIMDTWPLIGDIQHRIEDLAKTLNNPLIQDPTLMRKCVNSHLQGISQVIDAFRVKQLDENAKQFKD
jgi:hypothetical protein